jgi:hypothetical protein
MWKGIRKKKIYLFLVMIWEGVQTRYNELTSGYFRQGLHVFLLKNKFFIQINFKQNLLQIVIKIIVVPICT